MLLHDAVDTNWHARRKRGAVGRREGVRAPSQALVHGDALQRLHARRARGHPAYSAARAGRAAGALLEEPHRHVVEHCQGHVLKSLLQARPPCQHRRQAREQQNVTSFRKTAAQLQGMLTAHRCFWGADIELIGTHKREAECRLCGPGLRRRTSLSGSASGVRRSRQAGQTAHSYLQPVSASLRYSASLKGAEASASTAACTDTVLGVHAKASTAETAMESALTHTSTPRGPSQPWSSTLRTSTATSSRALRCAAFALPGSAPSAWLLCASGSLAVLAPEVTPYGA